MIYLDNAATTKLLPEALEAMTPFLTDYYGNAGAVYSLGVKSRSAVNNARKIIAGIVGAEAKEIYFTSGGSEADNWAIKGVMYANRAKGKHMITTKAEHHAVLNTCKSLEREGFEVTYLPIEKDGTLSLYKLKNAIRKDTVLISIMTANNEIGTVYPISEIGKLAHENGIIFHTDAVQAFGHLTISVKDANIDLLSATGHKFHGPKGVGFLYVKEGLNIFTHIDGGSQERNKRAGTENVAGIVGMSKAAEHASEVLLKKAAAEKELRDYFAGRIVNEISDVTINGTMDERLPGNINFCFDGVKSESVLIMLDIKGICASAGAACTSGDGEPSHVLRAIGLSKGQAESSLRFSLSEFTTRDEIDKTVDALKEIIDRIRSLNG